jgi:hypothetical protein
MPPRLYIHAEFDHEEITGIYFDPRLLAEDPEPGTAIVADLLRPVSFQVDEATISDISWYDASRIVETAKAEAVALSEELGSGIAVGKLFTLPHEDGEAWYIVTELTDAEAEVEWRGFGPNRRRDGRLGWGGVFNRMVIQGHVARHDAIRAIGGVELELATVTALAR